MSFVLIGFASSLAVAAPLADAVDSDDSEDYQITYDVSASTGSSGGRSYSEIGLGVNLNFSESLAWRNAGFGRFIDGLKSEYGVDTSARFTLRSGDRRLGLTLFGGPGYRFSTKNNPGTTDSAPFAEGGVVAHLGGINVGAGIKTIFGGVVDRGSNETQYFLILSGGGSL